MEVNAYLGYAIWISLEESVAGLTLLLPSKNGGRRQRDCEIIKSKYINTQRVATLLGCVGGRGGGIMKIDIFM